MRTTAAALGFALTTASVLLLGAPALAAGATVQRPAAGATVSSPVSVRVSVSRDLTENVSSVVVRLSQDGASAAAGTEPADLTCVDGCGQTSTQQVWGGVTLDPRAPSPFGANTPLANGTWYVQPAIDGGSFTSGSRILVSYEGSPVSGLAAAAEGREVALSWRRAPEPDINGYLVERRGSGSWTGVARLGPYASSHRDAVPSPGDWSYRVITERPDGSGGTYTTASITVDVAIEDPSAPSEDEGGSSGPSEASSDDGTDDGARTPSGGSTSGGATSGDGLDGSTGTSTTGADRGSETRGSRPGRVAPPPSVRRSAGVEADADVPAVAAPRERYYGEGDEYADELDYSGAPLTEGEQDSEAGAEPDADPVPHAVEQFLDSRLNSRSLLVPIAAGLLFVTLGLHIYRWMHAS